MVVFFFSDLDWKYPFWGKFAPEHQNYQFNLKFETKANFNMKNLVVLFTFSVFDWKYLFRGKFYPWSLSWVP